MSAPEGEVPPRVTLYWWPNGVYEYDLCRYSSECIDVPMLSVAEHEQLLLAEKQRGLRAVEEATKLKEQNIRLRAEMTELLEAVRLSHYPSDDRTEEARRSCMEYLKYIREQEAKAQASRAAKEPS